MITMYELRHDDAAQTQDRLPKALRTRDRRQQHHATTLELVEGELLARRLRNAARWRVDAGVDADRRPRADLPDTLDTVPKLLTIEVVSASEQHQPCAPEAGAELTEVARR